MPELPEVEAARRLADRELVGKMVIKVIAADDEKVFEGVTPEQFQQSLLSRRVVAARRKGKHMWLEFEDGNGGPCLLFHFGMTGGMVVRGRGGAHYQRYSVDDTTWPPRFCKLQLEFNDGTQLAFADSRRFARVRLLVDPLANPPLSELGWDPLLSMPSEAEFILAVGRERRAIKALLLDQSFSAGVGNWVADEVLYQARIHPEQPACSLTTAQSRALHRWIPEVCQTASDVDAESHRLPDDWLFHHRWGKGNSTKAKIGGHTIDHITVGGRTSAYVPALQKLDKTAAAAAKPAAKPKKVTAKKAAGKAAVKTKAESNEGLDVEEEEKPVKRARKQQQVESRSTEEVEPAPTVTTSGATRRQRKTVEAKPTAAMKPAKAAGSVKINVLKKAKAAVVPKVSQARRGTRATSGVKAVPLAK